MESHAAEATGANETAGGSNLQYCVLQAEHWNKYLVTELLDRNWKNEELLKLFRNYETLMSHAAQFQEYLRSANNYQSLVQIPHHLDIIYKQLMRESLQSLRKDLSEKLRRVKFWMMVSAFAFLAFMMLASVAANIISRKIETAAAAAAPAVVILLGAIGTWTHAQLRKHKDDVKKHFEITGVMDVAAKNMMKDFDGLRSSTMIVLEMAESAGVGEMTEALMELRMKAVQFCQVIRSARELTLQCIINHLDSITSKDEVDNGGVGDANEIGDAIV